MAANARTNACLVHFGVEMFATADINVNENRAHAHIIQHHQSKLAIFHSLMPYLGVLGAILPIIHHAPAVMLSRNGQIRVEAAETYVTENSSAHLLRIW